LPKSWGIREKSGELGGLPGEEQASGGMETISGTYEVKVDERGRVAIPARLLDALTVQLGEKPAELVIGLGLSPNVCIHTHKGYAAMLDEVNAHIEREKAEGAERLRWTKIRKQILESRDAQELDKQNRMRIPSPLAKQFNLSGEIIVQGSYDHLELVSMMDYENDLRTFRETMTRMMG